MYEPLLSGAVITMAGGVLSIFTVAGVAELVLPAMSVQVPLTIVPAVSSARMMGEVQLAIPLRISPSRRYL